MKNKTSLLKGARILSKKQQKSVNGGAACVYYCTRNGRCYSDSLACSRACSPYRCVA